MYTVVAGMRARNATRAVLLALATALIYSLTAVLTKSAVTELGEGAQAFFTSWEPYAGVALGAVALLVNQSAFLERGHRRMSLSVLTDHDRSYGYGHETIRGVAARLLPVLARP